MLLSRFWYLILALALGASVVATYVIQNYYNRTTERWMKDALAADSLAVSSALKDDARVRAAQLIPLALDKDIREGLAKASEADEIPKEAASKVATGVTHLAAQCEPKFSAVYATDADGRIIGSSGGEYQVGQNIGGYSVVADALAGWIRDDTWYQNRLVRVVARPVERDGGGEPVGAIVGVTIIDTDFATAVAKRTGAAVAFFSNKVTDAAGLPYAEGDQSPTNVSRNDLDTIQSDLAAALAEPEYGEKGRSKVRSPRKDLGIVYSRLPGEAADLGAGYAVGRKVTLFKTPWEFVSGVEKQDTDSAPRLYIILAVVFAGLLGIFFTVFEHTMPLNAFKREASLLGQGKIDALAPSRFRGVYKKIAADINDGVDKIAAKGGVPRRAADLEGVLGPIPAQPTMSAFAVPDAPTGPKRVPKAPPRAPGAADEPPPSDPSGISGISGVSGEMPAPRPSGGGGPPRPPPPPRASGQQTPSPVSADDGFDEMADWKKVYEEYLVVRRRCGEPTDTLTFDKFKSTLERNKAALVERHNCTRVKFTVYEKDGKAALKASPMK